MRRAIHFNKVLPFSIQHTASPFSLQGQTLRHQSFSPSQLFSNPLLQSRFYSTEEGSPSKKKKSPISTSKPKAPPRVHETPFHELKKGEPIASKPGHVKPVYTKKKPEETVKPATENNNKPTSSNKRTPVKKNEKGEVVLPLGSDFLRTTIRTYNNMTLVDIRKFYKDSNTGEMKPGTKGISLSIDQWNELKAKMEYIDQAISMMPPPQPKLNSDSNASANDSGEQ